MPALRKGDIVLSKTYLIIITESGNDTGINTKVDVEDGDVFTLTKTANGKTVHVCDVVVGNE